MNRHVIAETAVELGDGSVVRVTEARAEGDRVAILALVSPDGDAMELELDDADALRVVKALAPVAGVSV